MSLRLNRHQVHVLDLAAVRGPWVADRRGRLRNPGGCCPIEAAAGMPPRSAVAAADKLNLGTVERFGLTLGADCPNDPLRRLMVRVLGGEFVKGGISA